MKNDKNQMFRLLIMYYGYGFYRDISFYTYIGYEKTVNDLILILILM